MFADLDEELVVSSHVARNFRVSLYLKIDVALVLKRLATSCEVIDLSRPDLEALRGATLSLR